MFYKIFVLKGRNKNVEKSFEESLYFYYYFLFLFRTSACISKQSSFQKFLSQSVSEFWSGVLQPLMLTS